MSTERAPRPVERWERWALAAILAAAALLRFAHLDAGLRHAPHMDERYFVDNAARMLATRSLDPGWYEYPGLMFDVLLPVMASAHATDPPAASAYLAARALIAGCGVMAVGLAWFFGRRLAGAPAAVFAAALLAVSPVHVETAHTLRPDVALECLVLLAFLTLLRMDGSWQRDLQAGTALGLAVGLKFSGALLVVPFLAARLRLPAWVRGVLLAGATAALVFALVSPYALIKAGEFGSGLGTQLTYHYQEQPVAPEPYLHKLLAYASVWPKALGWPAFAVALAGASCLAWSAWRKHPLPGLAREARAWLPFLLLPPLTAAVMASTGYFFNRHLLPSMSVVALLAGLAWQLVGARSRAAAVALMAVCLAVPAWATSKYLAAIGRPSTRDRAADWLAAHVAAPARVLTNVPGLRADTERFELVRPARLDDAAVRLLADEVGAIVSVGDEAPALARWPMAETLEPRSPWEGPRLRLRPVGTTSQPVAVSLAGVRLTASDDEAGLEALRDRRLDTFWSIAAERGQRHWIALAFPAPVRLQRVELLLGDRPDDAGRGLTLEVARGDDEWQALACLAARPPTREQLAALGGWSELLVCPEVETRTVRIVRQAGARAWSVAELRVFAARARAATTLQRSPAPQ